MTITTEEARDLISRLSAADTAHPDLLHAAAGMIQDLLEGREAMMAAATISRLNDDLSQQMVAAGMFPLDALLKPGNLDRFTAHAGVRTSADFVAWVEKKHESYLKMQVTGKIAKRAEDRDLDSFVLGKTAAFKEVLANIRQTELGGLTRT